MDEIDKEVVKAVLNMFNRIMSKNMDDIKIYNAMDRVRLELITLLKMLGV